LKEPRLAGQYGNPFLLPARHATQAGEIESSESIPRLLKRLQIWALLGNKMVAPPASTPFYIQASGQIFKDDMNDFSSTSQI
jgi:hypothetical protein